MSRPARLRVLGKAARRASSRSAPRPAASDRRLGGPSRRLLKAANADETALFLGRNGRRLGAHDPVAASSAARCCSACRRTCIRTCCATPSPRTCCSRPGDLRAVQEMLATPASPRHRSIRIRPDPCRDLVRLLEPAVCPQESRFVPWPAVASAHDVAAGLVHALSAVLPPASCCDAQCVS